MTNTDDKVRDLLHEAGETHHIVFRLVDGVDDDWASRYSEWLIAHSELPEILGKRPVRSELTWLLVQLDKDYVERTACTGAGIPVYRRRRDLLRDYPPEDLSSLVT
jgi:hypothetical protein